MINGSALFPSGISSKAFNFHDIALVQRWSLSDPIDPLGTLLSAFPPATGRESVTITLDLSSSSNREKGHVGFLASCRPIFFFGCVQVYVSEQGFVLSDGASTVVTHQGTSTISASLARLPSGVVSPLGTGILHMALPLVLREHGVFDIHAGAVVTAAGHPYVIVGDSGAGKTTLTLALLESGCSYLGDDKILIRRHSDKAIAYLSYPREFHLTSLTLEAFSTRFAGLSLEEINLVETGELPAKRSVAVSPYYPSAHRREAMRPAALLFPHVVSSAISSVKRMASAEAFGLLIAGSALAVVDGISRRDEQLALLRDIVNAARNFEIQLGRDLLTQPQATAERLKLAIDG